MGRAFLSPFPLALAHHLIAFANSATAPCHPDTPLCYAICDAATNTFIGTIGAKTREDIESGTLVVGYWIGKKWWGRGIMTEVLRWYVKWVFDEFQEMHRLEALVHEANEASRKVLERVGFVYEGTRRRAGEKDGEVFGIQVFGLLREECV
jgi:RimJ/RimL family protein N-acetyltransferase